MPGIEELSNWQDPWDYGARGDGNQGDAGAINAAIAAGVARNGNGCRIVLRPSSRAYMLDASILAVDDLEFYLPAGAQLQIRPGLDIAAFLVSGVHRFKLSGGGTIIGTYDFTKTHHGIYLLNSFLCSIEGVHIAGMALAGIAIDGGSDHSLDRVVCVSNGRSGILIDNATTRNVINRPICYNNGQGASGGDGIHLDRSATHTTIASPSCFDGIGPFPTLQAYPVREVAASGCDFTTIVGLQATGNVTSQAPSLIGTNSKWTDAASTIALVGTPANVAGAALLGTSLNGAPLDHVHALASMIAPAGSGAGAGGTVALTGGQGGATGVGGAIALTGGSGGATSGNGGGASLVAGTATNGNADGGTVSVLGGTGHGSGNGGPGQLLGGNGGATGNGGELSLFAGNGGGTGGNGGGVDIEAGTAIAGASNAGGSVLIASGGGFGAGLGGDINLVPAKGGATGSPGRLAGVGAAARAGSAKNGGDVIWTSGAGDGAGNGGRLQLVVGAKGASGLKPLVEIDASGDVPTGAVLAAGEIGFRLVGNVLSVFSNNAGIKTLAIGTLA